MIHRTSWLWLLILLPALAAAAPPPATPSTQPPQWDNYRILSEQNIFLRNRARPMTGQYLPRPAVAAPSEDARFVLTGIIQQGDDCVAFFEDSRSGKTIQTQTGDTVGRGRLTVITLDTVHYACDGDIARITVGSNLTGAAASPRTTAAATTTPTPPATPGAPPAGMPPGLIPPPAGMPMVMPTAAGGMTPPPAVWAVSAPSPGAGPPGAGPTGAAVILNVSGSPNGMTFSVSPPPGGPPQAAGSSPESRDPATMSVLERMRLRREQEMNK
jgi:hypothetical protein